MLGQLALQIPHMITVEADHIVQRSPGLADDVTAAPAAQEEASRSHGTDVSLLTGAGHRRLRHVEAVRRHLLLQDGDTLLRTAAAPDAFS